MKNRIKILTDIRIRQSDIWGKATRHVSECYSGNLLNRIENLIRTKLRLLSFLHFIIFVSNTKEFDIFVTANIFTAQLVALYRRVFRIIKPGQIILELMLDEECMWTKWKVKEKIQRYIFSSVDIIFVSSLEETITYAKRLALPRNRIKFLPFHTNIKKPKIIEKTESFILSAGRTGRDYETLIEAVKNLPVEVRIISDKISIEGIILPKNVKLMIEVSYEKYIESLKNCWFVVVPLRELVKSTGQVVILEAMGFGKPVIATEVVGTRNYIKNGENGILVPPQNIEKLKSAILSLISDKELHRKLTKNGYEKIIREHSFTRYVTEILHIAERI